MFVVGPDGPAGAAALPTRHHLSGIRVRRSPSGVRRDTAGGGRGGRGGGVRRPGGEPLWRDGDLDGFELSSGARVCADVVIGADGADQPRGRRRRSRRPGPGAVGFRPTGLCRRPGDDAAHRCCGSPSPAGLSRLRLAVPRRRRPGQHRPGSRDAVRSGAGGAAAAQASAPSPRTCAGSASCRPTCRRTRVLPVASAAG